jgi:hypothetical protein
MGGVRFFEAWALRGFRGVWVVGSEGTTTQRPEGATAPLTGAGHASEALLQQDALHPLLLLRIPTPTPGKVPGPLP